MWSSSRILPRHLFSLKYMNDLLNVFSKKTAKEAIYADDTSIAYSSNDIDKLNETLYRDKNSFKQ